MTKQIYKCIKCKSPKTVWNQRARNQRLCKDCGTLYTIDDGRKIQGMIEEFNDCKNEIKRLSKENKELENTQRLLSGASGNIKVPTWTSPKRNKKDASIATIMLSDCHFDEVVEPREVNYVNSYNRKIATARLKLFFQNAIRLSRDHMGGINIEGLILILGGDMVSGNIHEELKMTNEDGIMGTVVYWTGQLVAGIEILTEHFEKIHIPCVTGNHGRNTQKPVKKGRARDNFDWLIYKLIELQFVNRSEITFDISEGTDCRYKVYKTRYQVTHGDQFRGGSGISGICTPISLGNHRKQQRELATGSPYDILLMGHFHQYIDGGKFMINGSLKGYDEYASSMNFGFETAKQLFFLTDPKWGKTITAPIHCYKKGEGWEK